MESIDWDLIRWAQSPLIEVECDGRLESRRLCHEVDNIRATPEGCYCVTCWDKLPKCVVCGDRGAKQYSKNHDVRCDRHSNDWEAQDKIELRQTARDCLYRNTTWEGVAMEYMTRHEFDGEPA